MSKNACEVAVASPSNRKDFYMEIEAQLQNECLRVGENWYVIDQSWWCRFMSAVQSQENDKRTIDSEPILNEPIVDTKLSCTSRSIVILKPLLVRSYFDDILCARS